MNEILTIYNERLEKIDEISRDEVHKKGLLHKVVHCWIAEKKENKIWIYFQQRSFNKVDFAGLYDIACAGHVDTGEIPQNTMVRELEEEIGLEIDPKDLIYIATTFEKFKNDTFFDNEICEVYLYKLREFDKFINGEEVEKMVKVSLDDYEKWTKGYIDKLIATCSSNDEKIEIKVKNACLHVKQYNKVIIDFIKDSFRS